MDSSGHTPAPQRRPRLYVPVLDGTRGMRLRMFRTPLGTRTAVAFTSEAALRRALGPEQEWVRLGEPALRALTAPLGADRITVDPLLTARRPYAPAAEAPEPQAEGEPPPPRRRTPPAAPTAREPAAR
ncbi:SAV_915 family protein [Streptomyces sp. MAR4 CNX-425]|uniref:SAV_915 family protein n=1 Tax=Streptomyces sp. MAR4 CNX-425 TaxID=3406343 RepID=UPI003B50EF8C